MLISVYGSKFFNPDKVVHLAARTQLDKPELIEVLIYFKFYEEALNCYIEGEWVDYSLTEACALVARQINIHSNSTK